MSAKRLRFGGFKPTKERIEMPPENSKDYGRIDREALKELIKAIKAEKVVVIPVADKEKPEAEKRVSKPKVVSKNEKGKESTR